MLHRDSPGLGLTGPEQAAWAWHGPWQASQQTQTSYFVGDVPLEGRGPGIL